MDEWVRQAGVAAVRGGKVCLVTSRTRGRWVIPKGVIDPGRSAGEAALIEAWEEAGLAGTLAPEPLGSYLYEKWGAVCHVVVFRMRVTEVRDRWPEHAERQRCWLPPAEAAEHVEEEDLRAILRALEGG
ncbi:MAG TPA: NUDIX hydrolase [Gemmataceae bacterium]